MRSRIALSLIFGSLLLLHFASSASQTTFAQSSEEAEAAIQEASDKLIAIFKSLEDLGVFDEDVRELVARTDSSLQLINEAKQLFTNSQYDLSIDRASQAIVQLGILELEIEGLKRTVIRESWLIYSIIGFVGALATVGFVFLFIRKIYPWYKRKSLEEYGNLEIIYKKEKEG